MPKAKTPATHVRSIVTRQKTLLAELVALGPKECADPDTTDVSLTIWRSPLLALDNAFWSLDDLADDLEFFESESQRTAPPDEVCTSPVTNQESDHAWQTANDAQARR